MLDMKIGVGEFNKALSFHLNQVAFGDTVLTITSRGVPKVVVVNVERYKHLLGIEKGGRDEPRRDGG